MGAFPFLSTTTVPINLRWVSLLKKNFCSSDGHKCMYIYFYIYIWVLCWEILSHLWAPRFLCCDAKHVFSWIPSLCIYSWLKAPKLLYSILLIPRLLCLLPNCYLRMWIALCPKTVCCDTTLQDLLSWPSMDVDGSRLDSFATLPLMPSGWPHPLDISPHAKTVFTVSSFSLLRNIGTDSFSL